MNKNNKIGRKNAAIIIGTTVTSILVGGVFANEYRKSRENLPSTFSDSYVMADGFLVLSVNPNPNDTILLDIPMDEIHARFLHITTGVSFQGEVKEFTIPMGADNRPQMNNNIKVINDPTVPDINNNFDAPITYDYSSNILHLNIPNSPGGATIVIHTDKVAAVTENGTATMDEDFLYHSITVKPDHKQMAKLNYPFLLIPITDYTPPKGKDHVISITDHAGNEKTFRISYDGDVSPARSNPQIANLPEVDSLITVIDGMRYIRLKIDNYTSNEFYIYEMANGRNNLLSRIRRDLRRIIEAIYGITL